MNIVRNILGSDKWQNDSCFWLMIRICNKGFTIENSLRKHYQRFNNGIVVRAHAQFDA